MEVDGMNLGKAKISGSVNRQKREAGKKKGQKKGNNLKTLAAKFHSFLST
jgi:hypothetical protein